ncbi:ABC transporter permease subunit [Lacibacterium aquatile]|uniref:ABC transporter permease subunit n=1 Tax=Lacibacterium aquatile TaxID=1168082 RepID=A0ABW5DQC4_9PROT
MSEAQKPQEGKKGLKLRLPRGQTIVIGIPFLWLALFFVVPFLIVLKISFSMADPMLTPPFSSLVEWVEGSFTLRLNFGNYQFLGTDGLYIETYLFSLKTAAISTVLCLAVGYPMAYAMARSPQSIRPALLMLVILPFWTSFLIRIYAWIGLLSTNGIINNLLMGWGVIDEPLVIMNTPFAVYIGIVYTYLPFMILPLYATLEKMDLSLLEAAADLGCRPVRAFFTITVPLSKPGIISGSMLVFIPAVGEFVIPELLGGAETYMIGNLLWNEFFNNRDWPLASAVAVVMLFFLVAPIMWFQRSRGASGGHGV